MNWLAHIFLSETVIDYQLGNLLADPCKGKAWNGASLAFKQGLEMHKRIDTFTDKHPLVLKSKSRLGPQGHLKGVVVDLCYDLLLTQHWHQYSNVELNHFLDEFYALSHGAIQSYPIDVSSFVKKLIKSDHLRNYKTISDLENTFKRVDTRLSERVLKKESTLEYLPWVETEFDKIEEDFLGFFPDLLQQVRDQSDETKLNHWM